jgi:SAM-dependent methyltransferase
VSFTRKTSLRHIASASYRMIAKIRAPVDRTRDLKRAYGNLVAKLKMAMPLDEAMSRSVGGAYDVIGPIELAVLRHAGLRQDQHLIDVGCGSGRLAVPLSSYLTGKYSGFDVVADLIDYARKKVGRPDWRFETINHIGIPEPDACADMVCFFSVLTHLLHEQSYWYLEEAKRVLKPGGRMVISFLDFSEEMHWDVFMATLAKEKRNTAEPMNVFLSRDAIGVWARHLGLDIVEFLGARQAVDGAGALGQAVCVLQKR